MNETNLCRLGRQLMKGEFQARNYPIEVIIQAYYRLMIFIEGEGSAPAAMPSPRLRTMVPEAAAAMEGRARRRSTRASLPVLSAVPGPAKFQPDDAGLIALGQALEDPFMPGAGDSLIPPGSPTSASSWTTTSRSTARRASPTARSIPRRSSRGGRPPWNSTACTAAARRSRPNCTRPTGVRLKIGTTTGRPIFGVTQTFPNDLPRRPADDPETPERGGRSSATRATTRT